MDNTIPREIFEAESDFLCKECTGLLYLELKSKKEYCLNPKCKFYPTFILATDSTNVKKTYELGHKKLMLRMMQFNKEFIEFVFDSRMLLISDFYTGKALNKDKFFALNEILRDLNEHKPRGRINNKNQFQKLIDDYTVLVERLNFLDNVENGIYVIGKNSETLAPKYWNVFMDLYENYGIIAPKNLDLRDLFKFDTIDKQNLGEVEIKFGMEFKSFFRKHFRHIVALRYMLESYYREMMNFDYDVSVYDIVFLWALFHSLKANKEVWTSEGLKNHAALNCGANRTFKDIKSEYIKGQKIPILFEMNTNFLVDKHSLIFFIFYLVGKYGSKEPTKDVIREGKELASIAFEDAIRDFLKDKGYVVTGEELKIKYGYDIIAYNEERKNIFLIEAKYRDFAPSSITGINFLKQEIYPLTDKGLLGMCLRQKERHDFFIKNFKSFKGKLNLKYEFGDYKIESFIITKYIPLIKKYKEVSLLSFGSIEGIV